MGAMKWRAQELIFLENVAASEEGRAQLKMSNTDRREGRSYWFRNATNLFVKKYRDEFTKCFEEEMTVEFAYRQQRQPHAKLQSYAKETEAERDARLSTRIESWLKSQSEGRTRGKRSRNEVPSNDPPATNVSVTAPPITLGPTSMDSLTLGVSTAQFASAHILQGFSLPTGANDHPQVASVPIPAIQVVSTPRSAMPTDEQLYKVLSLLKEIQLTLLKDRGWVGWCLFGGLDGRGDLGNFDHCTAYDRAGLSFEEFLAGRLGVTVSGLLTIFENFVGSSFGLPARPLETSTLDAASVIAGPVLSALPAPDTRIDLPSTPVHTSLSAPASISASRLPHTAVFQTPEKPLASLLFSPIPSQSEDSLGLLATVAADATLISSPAARSNKSSHMPPASAKSTTEQSQLNADSPRVVFGPPPPRVLTTAPEKPPARRRGRAPAARARSGGNSHKGTKKKTKAHKTGASEPSQQEDILSLEALTSAGAPEQLAVPGSPALGRGKRQRVSMAKALDQSPDMSAANKLKRRADGVLRGMVEPVDVAERLVKRRKY